ncbi:signal peptidase II [Williamsia deligens]|uniref:Lipoprotein signal peptidase n=1 Tax=Williamsia deligens TaxID=321325 RepID=A0ABW3GA18_9NOCA|nr:signal peptidase II [Williamsia deligens]
MVRVTDDPRADPAAPPVDGRAPQETAATGHPGRSRAIVAVLPVVALVILVADLVTKIIVVATIDPGRPVHVIGDTVTLRLVRNSGAAFSFATGYTWVLTIVAAAVVVGIIRFSGRLRSVWWAVGLGLVLGGAIGNLVDRFFRSPGPLRGHVVDFVSVGWWPVFNVADSAVVCGAVLLVALTVFGVEIDGTRSAGRDRSGSADA